LSHLEFIGSIIAMLSKGAKGQLAEGSQSPIRVRRQRPPC
jgi:Mn-containing catalase